MSKPITKADIEATKQFGTPVTSGTMRYAIPLDKLGSKFEFENPKDAGTEWGKQVLKGDGNDVLLLNGLTAEQVAKLDEYAKNFETEKGKPLSDMNILEVKKFMGFLAENGYNDRYCSDKQYMDTQMTPNNPDKRIGLYARNKDGICRAVILPEGATYSDGQKTQRANVGGALLIVPENGRAEDIRITNVPEDYEPRQPGAKIATLAGAQMCMAKKMEAVRGQKQQ